MACNLASKGAIYKENSITYEEIGVILQEEGVTAIDTTHSVISTFVKMELPPTCEGSDESNVDIEGVISKQITMFQSLTNLEASPRQKRQLFAILGTSLLTAAFGTIGSLLIHHKANDNKDQFVKFARDQDSFNVKVVQFEREVVKVLKQTEEQYSAIKCEGRRAITTLQYVLKIQSMFSMLKNGVLCSKLTTDILDMEDIELILQQHPELNSTLYTTDSVAYFYRVAEICIADVSHQQGNSLAIHYLITIPFLTHLNTFPSYKVAQTGFTKMNLCYKAVIPRKVIKVGKHFKSIDNLNCKGDLLPICAAEPAIHMTSISCLENVTECSFTRVACKDDFVYDKAGLLIRHSTAIHFLDNTKTIKVVTQPANGVTFIPWADASLVQIGNRSVYSPTFTSSYIKYQIDRNDSADSDIILPKAQAEPLSHLMVIKSPSIWLVAALVCLMTVLVIATVCCARKHKFTILKQVLPKFRTKTSNSISRQSSLPDLEDPPKPEMTTMIIPGQ